MARIMIAGTGSGCGKTTVTCALLQAFLNRGKRMAAFKCGPDYIDPMFHREILGTRAGNLDGFFMKPKVLQMLLERGSADADLSVIEGVMGYYDGVGTSGTASSYQVARDTKTPVILILSCKGMSRSVQAVLQGFLSFVPESGVRGVIFNQLPQSLYPSMEEFCASKGIRALGCFPFVPEAQIESRHLGLKTAGEIADLKERVHKLAAVAEKCLDLDAILHIAEEAPDLSAGISLPESDPDSRQAAVFGAVSGSPAERSDPDVVTRIAVARDQAFCFYYQENLDLLREMGCELVEFSPLEDDFLPEHIHGLLLGGGYPELYAGQLQEKKSLHGQIRERVRQGMPVHAECGGFLYLHRTLIDAHGQAYEMAGVFDGACRFTDHLQHFGYVTMTAQRDNVFSAKGECIRAHEFHRFVSEMPQDTFLTEKGEKQWMSYVSRNHLTAGFPHIHFYANPSFAAHFVKCAREYARRERMDTCI